MIGKQSEYQKMYHAERDLWWYRVLHQKVATHILKQFPNKTTIRILDAGCGTGGLLSFLEKHGFEQLEGFDFSIDGVAFSQLRGLKVVQHDLTKLSDFKPNEYFDVIVCNDVFTYFTDETIVDILKNIRTKLKPNGLFITNNNAHAAFAGIHDIVVGGQKRFVESDLQILAKAAELKISYATYWSFVLSPLIMAVRAWQRFQLRRGWVDLSQQASDVAVPPAFINQALYGLVKLEEKLLPKAPFGSSIFITMRA